MTLKKSKALSGNILETEGRKLLDKKSYAKLLELCSAEIVKDPNNVKAYVLLGNMAYALGSYRESIGFYNAALEIMPNALHALAGAAACYEKLSERDKSFEMYNTICAVQKDNAEYWRMRCYVACFALHDPMEVKALREEWGDKFFTHKEKDRFSFPCYFEGEERQLRVGFIGGDFRSHAVHYVLKGVFGAFKKIRKFVYNTGNLKDKETPFYVSATEVWRDVATYSDRDLTRLIRSDKLDALIDLSGHTEGARLTVLANRVAPVQLTWWGYMPTLGLRAVDYRIADQIFFKDNEDYYIEKLLDVGCMLTYSPPDNTPIRSVLPADQSGEMTFISLNNSTKINKESLNLWLRVIDAIPKSRLIIIANFDTDKNAIEHVKEMLGEKIPEDLLHRISVIKRMPIEQYMEVGFIGDICLDAYPQSGGVTTLQAAWMGMPTLCLNIKNAVGGYSAGMMKELGFEIFCADDENSFVSRAVEISENLDYLRNFRLSIREKFHHSRFMQYEDQATAIEDEIKKLCIAFSKEKRNKEVGFV